MVGQDMFEPIREGILCKSCFGVDCGGQAKNPSALAMERVKGIEA